MKSDDLLHIMLVQADIRWENKTENLQHYNEMLSGLEGTADLILLPEMFSTGFSMNPAPLAESMDGTTVNWMRDVASRMNARIAGTIIIKEGDRFFNRMVCCDPEGSLVIYNKRHLFRMAGEEENYTPGGERLIMPLGKWNVCFQICYDLRFPVWSRNRKEYDILVYLSNWPAARSDVWNTLLRARAIENQCYTVGVNRVGTDGNGIVYKGESMAINPKGEVAAILSHPQESILSVSLSLGELNQFRRKFPVWKDWDDFRLTGN
jgi:predicted amidohydrolase